MQGFEKGNLCITREVLIDFLDKFVIKSTDKQRGEKSEVLLESGKRTS